jgi:ribosomal protein L39E
LAKRKVLSRKLRLAKAQRKARPVPAWIMGKTKGNVRRTPGQRKWRRTKIKL